MRWFLSLPLHFQIAAAGVAVLFVALAIKKMLKLLFLLIILVVVIALVYPLFNY
ncbi:MAG: hypothetical protein IPM61_15090 [Chlorobi bacterium]|nr:MAG: hypothetical protein UZ07_CHB004000956 [Chlorobi bacterium OLB7]MBK8912635.1 hypothetical protein [Chlorobiota bacterium]